jgi:hypothetical protein
VRVQSRDIWRLFNGEAYLCMLIQSLDALYRDRHDTIHFVNMFTCHSYTIGVNGFLPSAVTDKVPTIDTPSQPWLYSQRDKVAQSCKLLSTHMTSVRL